VTDPYYVKTAYGNVKKMPLQNSNNKPHQHCLDTGITASSVCANIANITNIADSCCCE